MTQKTRLTLCVAFLAYLAGDFFLFNGPLNRAIQEFSPDTPQALEKARKEGVVARVGNRPISRSQLDRGTFERLVTEGKLLADLSADEQKAARKSALDDLIANELLLAEIHSAGKPSEVPAAEIDERVNRLTARFGGDKGGLEAAMKAQGILSQKDLRDRIVSQLLIEKHVESRISPTVKPTEEEAKKWFEEHGKELALPERVEARHIFIPTLQIDPEEGKKKLEEALAQLTAKQKNFPVLAKELSQDPASKDEGGYLGWMSRARLSPDLAEPLFSMPVGTPALVRSRLGWHILEVMTRKGPEPRSYEEAKPEILSALEAVKRLAAVKAYQEKLRKSATVPIRILDPELASASGQKES